MEIKKGREAVENDDAEYIGNIWGWKLSFISLGIIVAMFLLMGIRYFTMDKPAVPANQQTIIGQDSLPENTIPKD